jgi:hypothetical protein
MGRSRNHRALPAPVLQPWAATTGAQPQLHPAAHERRVAAMIKRLRQAAERAYSGFWN